MSIYRLYWAPETGSFVIELLLREAGAAYESLQVEDRQAPEFLALNPLGKLPVLVIPEGTVMTESGAMLLELFARYPEAEFTPADEASWVAARRWLLFLTTELYPAYQHHYHSEHFTLPGGNAQEEVKAAGIALARRLWSVFTEHALGEWPFVLGERYSALDAYAFMLSSWDPEPAALFAREPKLESLAERMRARPEVPALLEKYRMASVQGGS